MPNCLGPLKWVYGDKSGLGFRVQVPNDQLLGTWVIVIMIQISGKYLIIEYLDP